MTTPAAALAIALALGPGAAMVMAATQPAPDYATSVDRALQTLRDARADDRVAAGRAADELEAGTGQSQHEILDELRASQPDVPDARTRLAALSRAVHSPAFVPEPSRAHQAVRDILAEPRYSGLGQGPSLGDRIRDALLRALVWVLTHIGAREAGGLAVLLVAAGAVLVAAVVLIVLRSTRWRGRGEARAGGAVGGVGGPGEDRFATADRLAAAGDLEGAVRALAIAVAVRLGGERAWEISPLTVRELFAGARDPESLRPLLLVFEAAVYGDRPPDAEAYRLAAAAAAPYRPAVARAAA